MPNVKAQIGSVRKGKDASASMRGIINNYNKLIRHIEDVTPEILLDALKPTFEKSQEYCPVDTGAMKESGYLEIVEYRRRPTVQIGYGFGGVPPYTATVHENLEWRHEEPTRAKWLQVALDEDASEIEERVINGLRGIF